MHEPGFDRHYRPDANYLRAAGYSPSTRRRCSSRMSSAMLVLDSRTSSANGALGPHERQDSEGKLRVQAVLTARPSMERLINPQRLKLLVVTTQSTISRECSCQRTVRKVLQRRAFRTAAIRHRQTFHRRILATLDVTIRGRFFELDS